MVYYEVWVLEYSFLISGLFFGGSVAINFLCDSSDDLVVTGRVQHVPRNPLG